MREWRYWASLATERGTKGGRYLHSALWSLKKSQGCMRHTHARPQTKDEIPLSLLSLPSVGAALRQLRQQLAISEESRWVLRARENRFFCKHVRQQSSECSFPTLGSSFTSLPGTRKLPMGCLNWQAVWAVDPSSEADRDKLLSAHIWHRTTLNEELLSSWDFLSSRMVQHLHSTVVSHAHVLWSFCHCFTTLLLNEFHTLVLFMQSRTKS